MYLSLLMVVKSLSQQPNILQMNKSFCLIIVASIQEVFKVMWSMFFLQCRQLFQVFLARWAKKIWSWEMKAFWHYLGKQRCHLYLLKKLQIISPHWDRWISNMSANFCEIIIKNQKSIISWHWHWKSGHIRLKISQTVVGQLATMIFWIQMYSFPPAPSLSGDGGRISLCWPPSGLGDERRLPLSLGPGLCETLLIASFCVLVLFLFSRGLN